MNYHGYTQVISQQLPLSPGLHSQEVMTLEREQLCVTAVYAVKQMPDELNATPSLPGAIFFVTDAVHIFCYLQTPMLYLTLRKKNNRAVWTSLSKI